MQKQTLLLLVLLSLFALHVWHLKTVTDDAYISYRYARNLADGHGLVWNVGEAPVEGYTNFLWVILLAGCIQIGLPVEPVSLILGAVFALLTLLLVYRNAGQPLRAILLLVLLGPFAQWSSGGMETMMFTVLCFWGFHLHLQEIEQPERFPVSALILFLAALTRPEGFLVFAVIAAHNLLFAAIPKSRWMLWFVAFVLPFAVYFFWRYNYYGFLLPNTFYMKVGSTSAQVVRGFKYAASFFLLTVTPLLVLAAPFRKPLSYRIRCAFWIICAYTAYIILVGGDYMTLFRFFVPLLPFVAIVAADVSVSLPFPVFSLFLLLSILPSLNLERLSDGLPLPQRYWNIRQIAYPRVLFERSQVHRLSLLGKWMNENLPATATVAYDGIGAIGWFSNLKIIDMSGLNDIHIAHLPSPEMGHGVAGHEKEDLLYVLSRKPDYILFSRYFLAREELQPDVESLYRERLEKYPEAVRVAILNELRNYELQYVPLTDPWNGESGYMILLKRRQG